MRAASIALLHEDGTHFRWITAGEADRMEQLDQAERITARRAPQVKYRMKAQAQPSTSKISPCMLTRGDLNALIGMRRIEWPQLERLIGHGLVPETAFLSPSGFIRV
jgi:hypothetical protein